MIAEANRVASNTSCSTVRRCRATAYPNRHTRPGHGLTFKQKDAERFAP
jgi:hypothetical protein